MNTTPDTQILAKFRIAELFLTPMTQIPSTATAHTTSDLRRYGSSSGHQGPLSWWPPKSEPCSSGHSVGVPRTARPSDHDAEGGLNLSLSNGNSLPKLSGRQGQWLMFTAKTGRIALEGYGISMQKDDGDRDGGGRRYLGLSVERDRQEGWGLHE